MMRVQKGWGNAFHLQWVVQETSSSGREETSARLDQSCFALKPGEALGQIQSSGHAPPPHSALQKHQGQAASQTVSQRNSAHGTPYT